jgi:kynurenine formamidase
MTAPTFHYRRMVDLSQPLRTGQQQHPWFRYETQGESIVAAPATAPPTGRWYVVTQLHLSGHAGTHVEAPYHAIADGATVGALPVERFFGEAVILDLRDVPWSQPVDQPRLVAAAQQAGGVRDGDIVFLHFDWAGRAVDGSYPPYPTTTALAWLVAQGIKLLGIDTPGLELPNNKGLVNHRLLFEQGIPLIESLVNLAALQSSRIYVFAQPLPVYDTDAMPLRVLAFEA